MTDNLPNPYMSPEKQIQSPSNEMETESPIEKPDYFMRIWLTGVLMSAVLLVLMFTYLTI